MVTGRQNTWVQTASVFLVKEEARSSAEWETRFKKKKGVYKRAVWEIDRVNG